MLDRRSVDYDGTCVSAVSAEVSKSQSQPAQPRHVSKSVGACRTRDTAPLWSVGALEVYIYTIKPDTVDVDYEMYCDS